jgi:hypothetical protein
MYWLWKRTFAYIEINTGSGQAGTGLDAWTAEDGTIWNNILQHNFSFSDVFTKARTQLNIDRAIYSPVVLKARTSRKICF